MFVCRKSALIDCERLSKRAERAIHSTTKNKRGRKKKERPWESVCFFAFVEINVMFLCFIAWWHVFLQADMRVCVCVHRNPERKARTTTYSSSRQHFVPLYLESCLLSILIDKILKNVDLKHWFFWQENGLWLNEILCIISCEDNDLLLPKV